MGKVLAFVNTQQPVVQVGNGLGTMPWLAWFRDVCAAVNEINTNLTGTQADLDALETVVAGLSVGTPVSGTRGLTVYPLGGGDIALVDNPSLVWMTVRNAVRVRMDWVQWYDQQVNAYVQVHSDANGVSVTPRLVAVDEDGAVTRVVATGTAALSTGAHVSAWSPLEKVSVTHGSGVEDVVLQVYTNAASQLITATGYLECGAPVASSSPSTSASSSGSNSPSASPSAT